MFALVLEFATKEEEKEEIIRLDEMQSTSSQDNQWSRSSLTQSVKVKLKGKSSGKGDGAAQNN